MIVEQVGYLNKDDLIAIQGNNIKFGLYKTPKKTVIAILETHSSYVELCYPNQSRLRYKLVEGRLITTGSIIYQSGPNKEIPTVGWNNGNQVMAYQPYQQ